MSANQNPEQQRADNQDSACAANGVTADGRRFHYSSAHNGYVYDEPAFIGPETWASWAGIETDDSELGEAGEPDGISIP